ncbi:MAG: ATP-binding protein, partial [Myxococcaceae bacterium]
MKKDKDLLTEAVHALCRSLKMPGALRVLDELARDLDARGAQTLEVMEAVLSTEVLSREASAVRLRIQEAHFPRLFTLEDFDFGSGCGVEKAPVMALATGALVDEKRNVVLVGPVGTGKTHLATGLGLSAARQRHRVAWYRAA